MYFGENNEKGGMILFRDGVKGVKGEDKNDDGFEYTPSDSLHSVHEFDYEDVSQWPKFNIDIDMGDSHFKKGILFSNREVLKEAIGNMVGRINTMSSWQGMIKRE